MSSIFEDSKIALLYNEMKEEIEKRKKIVSKYILSIDDVFIYKNRIFIVFEHDCYGCIANLIENLKYNNQQGIPEKYLSSVIYILLKIMMNQHSQGKVMRNLLETSFFITKTCDLKFLDLNLGNLFIEEQDKSKIFCAQNPQIVAPETIVGISDFDERSDIWSLGILTIYLIDGKYPFENQKEALFAIVNEEPPKPKKQISDSLKNFIKMILQKDPYKRASIQELVMSEFIQQKSSDKIMKEFLKKTFHQSKDVKQSYIFKTKDSKFEEIKMAENPTQFLQILFLQKKLNQYQELSKSIYEVEKLDPNLIEDIFNELQQ